MGNHLKQEQSDEKQQVNFEYSMLGLHFFACGMAKGVEGQNILVPTIGG